ncbi:MAG: LCP family protein [Clostridiales bacterium]|nr:LCP family protein [Clostridiales bacterium]
MSNIDEKEITAPEPRLQIEEPKKKKKWVIFVILGIVVVVLAGIIFGISKGLAIFQKIGLKIDAGSFSLTNVEPELKKDSTGKYTNCLIIGIDTRGTSDGLNTDTIIMASYNYDTSNVSMVSVPRDLTVEIGEGSGWYNKINAVYAFTKEDDDTAGLKELKRTVEELTGTEIQYYAMVNFDGFTQIVDAVGGVDINVENSFTDYSYPLGTKYQTVSFKSGIQTMDGETALQYARSRHSDDNGEGSDFMRARRQQKVIMAVKDKILSTETLTSPKAIMGLISSVADNIKISEFTISDIQAALNIAKDFNEKNGKTYSFVLDPSAANGQVVSNQNAYNADGTVSAYRIGPKLGLGKYDDINEFVDLLMVKPAIYSENAKIYVYNTGLGNTEVTAKVKALKEQYPYKNIVNKGTLYSDKEGTYIYTHTENEFIATVDEFATTLNITNKIKPEFITNNLNGEDVTILLGKAIQLAQ